MKKNFKLLLIYMIIIFILAPLTSYADMGPKPSVNITFKNMDNTLCYATLLSRDESTGPYSKWDGNEENIQNGDIDIEIWLAFAEYQDKDGYCFLQEAWKVSDTKKLNWDYYPPDNFKILLYYPAEDSFVVSEIYESYAFKSYFTIDMNDDSGALKATKSYNYTGEIVSFFVRASITLLIEFGFAVIFGFMDKKFILPIIIINSITQIGLNIALNIMSYQNGWMAMWIFAYIPLEIAVFVIETLFYCIYFPLSAKEKVSIIKLILYSLVANIASFIFGCFLNFILLVVF